MDAISVGVGTDNPSNWVSLAYWTAEGWKLFIAASMLASISILLMRCASGPPTTPTEDRPRRGCVDQMYQGRAIQMHVMVVGEYSHTQWLCRVDGLDYPVPIDKDQVRFAGCHPLNPTDSPTRFAKLQ